MHQDGWVCGWNLISAENCQTFKKVSVVFKWAYQVIGLDPSRWGLITVWGLSMDNWHGQWRQDGKYNSYYIAKRKREAERRIHSIQKKEKKNRYTESN